MISDKEYSKMEFNPTVKKDLRTVYPKLESVVGEADDRMMRYVILMYDANSPLKNHYPELAKRKEHAAAVAGYDLMKEDVTPLFDFKINDEPYDELLKLTMRFLKYQNNMVWQMIVSNEQAFHEYSLRVMMPVDGNRDKDILQAVEIKTKIMQSMDEIFQRLQRYTKELAGGDDNLEEMITKRKRLRPEEIANVQANR